MGKFLAAEKPRQAAFKQKTAAISNSAKGDGIYKDHAYPFCLPRECAAENLYPPIRDDIRAYFARNEIKWHDGQSGNPSNHMCDSQVCCANFLFPFAHQPQALAALLKPVFPSLEVMLPIEDGQYVAFEWIGEQDYLSEKKNSRNKKRSRGANCTSADAAISFRRIDNLKQTVMIEWKYTESYFSTSLKTAPSKRNRTEIYQDLYDCDDCPIDKTLLPSFDALFYEPFYQFMRQQFLAHEMEKAHEQSADIVSLLHIAPAHNLDFCRVTSPKLRTLGSSATEVWKKLVRPSDRFTSFSAEQLFGPFDVNCFPAMQGWKTYIRDRYGWVSE